MATAGWKSNVGCGKGVWKILSERKRVSEEERQRKKTENISQWRENLIQQDWTVDVMVKSDEEMSKEKRTWKYPSSAGEFRDS